jgi:hypothetical protein
MTPKQFAALAQLLRMQDGPSLTAARLVLVDGVPSGEAAAVAGISPAGASNALRRMRAGLALAQQATNAKKH